MVFDCIQTVGMFGPDKLVTDKLSKAVRCSFEMALQKR